MGKSSWRRGGLAAALGAVVTVTVLGVVVLTGGASSGVYLEVDKDDFGSAWPLTASSGTLRCGHEEVTFESRGTTYTLSRPTPHGENSNDAAPIWASAGDGIGKKPLGPLIEKGVRLCGG